MEKIGAVILAAGGSSRLGRPKQFLLHRGRTLLAHAVAAAAECGPVVVVAGRDGQRVENEVSEGSVCVVHHGTWERGIGSSIRAGVARALEEAPDLDGVFILLCDQPLVTAQLLALLREERCRQRKPIAACRYADSLGVPALFGRSIFPRLLSLRDDGGAKEMIMQSRGDVAEVAFPEGAIDVDTEAEVQAHLDGGKA